MKGGGCGQKSVRGAEIPASRRVPFVANLNLLDALVCIASWSALLPLSSFFSETLDTALPIIQFSIFY